MKRRQAWMLVAVLGLAAMGALHAAPSRGVLPRDLQGVWFPADAEGRQMCREYLRPRASGFGPDEGWMVLVGGVVIGPRLIHEVSEYGEGNFYVPDRVETRRAGELIIFARVGIDSMPATLAEPEDQRATLRVSSTSQGLLRWREESTASDAAYEAGPYFRCNPMVPKDWNDPGE